VTGQWSGRTSRPSWGVQVKHQSRQWKPSAEIALQSITRVSTRLAEGSRENFLYELKAGPAGGRLRRPSSRRQRHDGHRGTGPTQQPEQDDRGRVLPASTSRSVAQPLLPLSR
jgi:hypothetical protein